MGDEQNDLTGKWALITGAAKRIGECVVRRLHRHGAGIAIHYRQSAGPAEGLAAALNLKRPDSAIVLQADLRKTADLPKLVKAVVDHAGRLDILVNNASSFYATPLETVTEEQWDDLVNTNLKAPLFLSQAAALHLKQSSGVIVNMIDVHSTRPLRNHPVYGPTKAGLAMLTRSLAKDLAPHVRVNGVSPGAILWPDDGITEKLEESILKQVPLGRTGEPEDIASCVLYLIRDANYVTGQIIAVDGGRSIGW